MFPSGTSQRELVSVHQDMSGISPQAEMLLMSEDWVKDIMDQLDNIEKTFGKYRYRRDTRRTLMDAVKPIVNVLLTLSDVGGEIAASQVCYSFRLPKDIIPISIASTRGKGRVCCPRGSTTCE